MTNESKTEDEDDDIDEEEIFEGMCACTARQTGIPIERVKAIVDAAGLHAFGHCGIVDMIELTRACIDEEGRKP